jgi:hypothetical protein
MTPSIGRIVHYADPDSGKHLAGIITGFEDNGSFNITVFHKNGETSARFSLTTDKHQAKGPDEAESGQWWWPPRV